MSCKADCLSYLHKSCQAKSGPLGIFQTIQEHPTPCLVQQHQPPIALYRKPVTSYSAFRSSVQVDSVLHSALCPSKYCEQFKLLRRFERAACTHIFAQQICPALHSISTRFPIVRSISQSMAASPYKQHTPS